MIAMRFSALAAQRCLRPLLGAPLHSRRACTGRSEQASGFVLVDPPKEARPRDPAARRAALQQLVYDQAAAAEKGMQADLETQGFVLVDAAAATRPLEEDDHTDEEEDARDQHYEDRKLVARLEGTPGFNNEQVQAMLPLVRRDPSLLDDLQDLEMGTHFQTIARDPSKAQEVFDKYPKVKEMLTKVQRVKELYAAEMAEKAKGN